MKIGFIGTGNMGGAMIGGLLKKGFQPDGIIVTDIDKEKLEKLSSEYGITPAADGRELMKTSDIVILSVKPQIYDDVIRGIADLAEGKIIVGIAPGKTVAYFEEMFGSSVKAVRAMPNTPALAGEGMTALCPNKNVTEEEKKQVVSIFESFGKAEILEEKYFSAFTAIAGSSPAYAFMFIEAMADAAVLEGIPREAAYRYSAQALYGSAKMVLDTKKHPGELKDMVCSPGGTTIAAVAALEKGGFRAAVIDAVCTCTAKADSMK